MNRDTRSKLMIRTREFLDVVLHECNEYLSILEDNISAEEEKLGNIPEELASSSVYECISDECDALAEAKEMLEGLMTQLEDFPCMLGLKMRNPRSKKTAGITAICKPATPAHIGASERRTERFQAVLTPTLMEGLKTKSAVIGLSMNEIVVRALNKELEEA